MADPGLYKLRHLDRLLDQNFSPRGPHLSIEHVASSSPSCPTVAPESGRGRGVGRQRRDLWLREAGDLPAFGHLGLKPARGTRARAQAVTSGVPQNPGSFCCGSGTAPPPLPVLVHEKGFVASGASVHLSSFSSQRDSGARGAKGSSSSVTGEGENRDHFLRSPEGSSLSLSPQGRPQ